MFSDLISSRTSWLEKCQMASAGVVIGIILVILLFAAGVFAFYWFYIRPRRNSQNPVLTQSFDPTTNPLFNEEQLPQQQIELENITDVPEVKQNPPEQIEPQITEQTNIDTQILTTEPPVITSTMRREQFKDIGLSTFDSSKFPSVNIEIQDVPISSFHMENVMFSPNASMASIPSMNEIPRVQNSPPS